MAAAVVYFTQAIGSSVILINVVTVVMVVATGVGCVGWSVLGRSWCSRFFTNPPSPGGAVGKTDLVVVAVQGAPPQQPDSIYHD